MEPDDHTVWDEIATAQAQYDLTEGELAGYGKAVAFAMFAAALSHVTCETSEPRLVDLGSGGGHYGRFLKRYAPRTWRYLAIDSSEAMIQRAHMSGLDSVRVGIERLLRGGNGLLSAADVILHSQCIELQPDPPALLERLADVTRKQWLILHKLRLTENGERSRQILEPAYSGESPCYLWSCDMLSSILSPYRERLTRLLWWPERRIQTRVYRPAES